MSKGKGGEEGSRHRPGAGAPARAPFKLRFYTLSQGAAANGTRARRPANRRRASCRRPPMAARDLGAWAKQAALLGCSVWAGVGASSYLGCTWPTVLLGGFCVRPLLCVCEFFLLFFFFFCSAVLLPGGSQEARRRQRGAPTGQRVSAPGARAAGKRRRRRDAGVPGGPLGPDEREVEE